MPNNALELIHLRNAYYKKVYAYSLGIFFLLFLIICYLSTVVIYEWTHRPSPKYFATNENGYVIQETPLTKGIPLNEAEAWAKQAIVNTYSYDYINYPYQFQSARKYFTDGGWSDFMEKYNQSDNLRALVNRKQVVETEIAGPFLKEPDVGPYQCLGNDFKEGQQCFTWRMYFPINVITRNYNPISKPSANKWAAIIMFQRRPLLDSYQGLAIVQLNFVPRELVKK